MSVTRPVLRWHGGKWLLAPWIISYFPSHRVYVEPFGGAGSVLMRKERAYAEVWNDLDGEVVNLFEVMRSSRARELVDAISLTPFARKEFVQSYVFTEDAVERARRLIIRSFMGFGSNSHQRASGFRSNSNRSGTTPAYDWTTLPANMVSVIERLQGVVIEHRDATVVMQQHDGEDTLHYVDPPYLSGTRDAGLDYAHEMTDDDHLRMLKALKALSGMVVLSGYGNALYDDALTGWARVERQALADGARPRVEVLWLNPACGERLKREAAQMSFFDGAAA